MKENKPKKKWKKGSEELKQILFSTFNNDYSYSFLSFLKSTTEYDSFILLSTNKITVFWMTKIMDLKFD